MSRRSTPQSIPRWVWHFGLTPAWQFYAGRFDGSIRPLLAGGEFAPSDVERMNCELGAHVGQQTVFQISAMESVRPATQLDRVFSVGPAAGKRRSGTKRLFGALLLAIVAAPVPALAESRVALVIGEGAYEAVPELANPPNDAADVAAALKALGFKVTLGVNLDQQGMRRAIADFTSQADSDVSLLYYAGHGIQLAGHNYLVPIGARLKSAEDIARQTIALDSVLSDMGKGKGLHLVFLDACRNNPLAGGGAVTPSLGLAPVGKLPGFFIAFATQPDNVAFDGAGRNSPFAKALLGQVAKPGVDISSMMIAVRNDVFAATGGQQIPADESLLTKQIYFAGSAEESPENSVVAPGRAGARSQPPRRLPRPLS